MFFSCARKGFKVFMTKKNKEKLEHKLSAAEEKLEKRIQFIDLCVDTLGFVGTPLIMRRFDVQRVIASRDIQEYLKRTKDRLKYIHQLNGYIPQKNFIPLHEHSTQAAIELLGEGVQHVECVPETVNRMQVVDVTTALPKLSAVRAVFHALFRNLQVKVTYISPEKGKTKRTLSPHSLIYANGFYYVRVYDEDKSEFRNFKLNRFESSKLTSDKPSEEAGLESDQDWNTVVKLYAQINPRVKSADAVRLDYGIEGDVLTLETKKALSRFVMTAWQIAPPNFPDLPVEYFPFRLEREVEL